MTAPGASPPAEDVQALTDASGLTLEDAAKVVEALMVIGWELQPARISQLERRKRRAAGGGSIKDLEAACGK